MSKSKEFEKLVEDFKVSLSDLEEFLVSEILDKNEEDLDCMTNYMYSVRTLLTILSNRSEELQVKVINSIKEGLKDE